MALRRPHWLVLTVLLLACGSSSKGGGDEPKTEDLMVYTWSFTSTPGQ